jgi:hypothetical protein
MRSEWFDGQLARVISNGIILRVGAPHFDACDLLVETMPEIDRQRHRQRMDHQSPYLEENWSYYA